MSLLSNLHRGIKAVSFATGEEYLRNGYPGIYEAGYGGGISLALGQSITQSRALMLPAFYAGVKLISEDVASCTLLTLETKNEKQIEAKTHSAYDLLRYAPNPDMTAMQFRESLTAHAIMCGHGYARKEYSRGDSTRIIAFWPIMPYEIQRDADRQGRPVFIWTQRNEASKTLTADRVFQLNGFGLTGRDGLNLLQHGREALGLSIATQEYAARFFSQDQTPNIVLRSKGKVDVEGVKKAWAGIGPDGKRKPANDWHAPKVLQEDMEIEQLHPDAAKSQLLEQRRYQLLEVCRLLRLPPHKLAEMGRATWSNIGDENRSYVTGTLRPWFRRWEESLKLSVYGVQSPYFAEHDAEDLLRGDWKTLTEGLNKLQSSGVLSVNEVREQLNYNPIDGGDEHFIQLNMGTIQDVAAGPDAQQTQGPKLVQVGGNDEA